MKFRFKGWQIMRLWWMLVLVLSTALAFQEPTESVGLRRVKAFIEILNSRDLTRMESFIREYFRPKPEPVSTLADRAKRLLALSELGNSFSIREVLSDTPTMVVVRVKGDAAVEYEIKMNFETDGPHRAISVFMGGPGSQSGPPPKPYTDWKVLPDLLEVVRNDSKVPALCLAYTHGGSSQAAVVGVRNQGGTSKASLRDRWLVGSLAKSMTATMIARLVDRGILRWDTRIEEVFPDMPTRTEYRKVTLLQILHHRSGIVQDLYVNPEFLIQAAGPNSDPVKMREHYTQFTLNKEPIAKPGEKMRYSNAGYAIASHMAEVAAKKPFERLLQELLFGPLQMKSAKFGVPGTDGNPGGKNELMGHRVDGTGYLPYLMHEPLWVGIQAAAGAGLSMTAEDLLRFARYHLDGLRGHVRLMKPGNFEILHKPAVIEPGVTKYACGWLIYEGFTREPYHGHNGSDGTFRSEIAIWPEKNLAIVAIANAGSLTEPSPPQQALIAVYDRLDKSTCK